MANNRSFVYLAGFNNMQIFIKVILVWVYTLSSIQIAYCEKISKAGYSPEQPDVKLIEFSKKMYSLKKLFESGFASKKEVRETLGEPAFILKDKSEWSIQVDGQKDEWQYWHPSYATVSYILIFDKNDRLIMMSCRQLQNPANYFTYYDVDYYLSKDE